ncbi:MAG: MFS transporter [Opitutales bacterium]
MSSPSATPAAERFPNGPFTRYMVGEGISMTGTWMQGMALGWVMTEVVVRDGLQSYEGLLQAAPHLASGIVMLLLFRLGGAYADRHDKRFILQVCQVAQIGFALAIGQLVAHDALHTWHLIVAAALLGVSSSFEMPAAAAIVPELVAKENVAKAISVDRAVFHATRLIGPAAAGYLVGRYGAEWAFYLNAASFVALMIALATLPRRPQGTAEEEQKRQGGAGEGFRHVRQDKPSLAMVALLATNTLFVFPVIIVLLPLYAKNELFAASGQQATPQQMGLLMLCSGAGSVSGSLLIMALKPALRRLAILTGMVLACGALVSLSQADGLIWAGASLVALAVGVSTLVGLANTIVQERSPAELRGRVSAVAGLSFFGFLPFAAIIMGWMTDVFKLRNVLLGSSICYAVIGLVVMLTVGSKVTGEREAAE